MNVVRENEELLKIRQIEKISSIRYVDLYANEKKGPVILPGFMITYGDQDTILFLTAQDKYFEEYVKKIKECYQKEKGEVIREGIMGKQYLKIDSLSSKMLLNGNLDQVEDEVKPYEKEVGYKTSLLFEEDKLSLYLDILEYVLKETMKTLQVTLGDFTLQEGVNGLYSIKTKKNNEPVILPIYFEEGDSSFKVTIGNLLENSIPFQVEVSLNHEQLRTHCYIEEYGYSDDTTYELKDEAKKRREVYLGDKLLLFKEEKLEQRKDRPVIAEKLVNEKDIVWYNLPWNATLGRRKKNYAITEQGLEEKEGENRLLEEIMIYLGMKNSSFDIKYYASKKYQKRVDDRTLSYPISLDKFQKEIRGRKVQDKYLIETYFPNGGITSAYKTYLSGNYFYQVSDSTLDKMYFLNREDGLEEKADLLDEKIYCKKVGE